MGKTFTMDDQRKPHVIYGLLHSKLIVILESTGSSGYQPGGSKEALNHADKAVRAIFEQLGVRNFECLAVEGVCEDSPEEIEQSWKTCERRIDEVAERIKIRWRDKHLDN